MKKIIIAIMLSAAASLVSAEFWSGNDLKRSLDSSNTSDVVRAYGYISGVSDSLQGIAHCPPSGVTLGQIVDMVRNMLVANASARHLVSGDVFVRAALEGAWPCEKKREGTAL